MCGFRHFKLTEAVKRALVGCCFSHVFTDSGSAKAC